MNKDMEKFEKFLHHIECIYPDFIKTDKHGIEFYRIGHNASHNFYIGYRDGLFFRLSEGTDPDDKDVSLTCHFNFSEISDSYLGHF